MRIFSIFGSAVFHKFSLIFFSAAVLSITATPTVAEDIINLSTGLDNSNNLITRGALSDAHWTVDQPGGGQGPAQTVYPDNPDWFHGTGPADPEWMANGPNSDWIARNANTSANGLGTFTRTFDLSGLDPSNVSIHGAWAIDDQGTLSLNGHQLAALPNLRWDALTPFSVAPGASFLNPGLNTLTIKITSTDTYLEAVRLEGGVSVVPEPSMVLMLMAGLITILVSSRGRSDASYRGVVSWGRVIRTLTS